MNNTITFLEEIAERLLSNHSNLSDVTVIFPNRRSGVFLKKELTKKINKPTLIPKILSINDYFLPYSSLQLIDRIEAIYLLYKVYCSIQKKTDSFDKFFFWGEVILSDFEEIDSQMIDAKKLFISIKDQKELDESFNFLDENERLLITSFWKTFLPKTTTTQQSFKKTWEILFPLYDQYKKELEKIDKGYESMIYRSLVDQMPNLFTNINSKVYFVGFNDLNKPQEQLIKYFVTHQQAEMIFDFDQYYFNDKKQEAGVFFRKYARDSVLKKFFLNDIPKNFVEPKNIVITRVPLEVGQAKVISHDLSQLSTEAEFNAANTAIVLPDERMLQPILNSIPSLITSINITMGITLNETTTYSLLQSLLELQINKTIDHSTSFFHHQSLKKVLMHPLIFPIEEDKNVRLITKINKKNVVRISASELLFDSPQLSSIFVNETDSLHYLKTIFENLLRYWSENKRPLEVEWLTKFLDQILQLQAIFENENLSLAYDFVKKLFKRLARSLKIYFKGEPVNGLQIIGMLESRNLDFQNVIIPKMNEGSWPVSDKKSSFIPYNIKAAFNMRLNDTYEAISAYLFYRIVQRAKNLFFYYSNVTDFNINGEKSRFLMQLESESNHVIQNRTLDTNVIPKSEKPIAIQKTSYVMDKLKRFRVDYQGNDKSKLTPSALNAYLDCKLKFYFRYVEKLYKEEDISEEIDAMVFGNILHKTLESLYDSLGKKKKQNLVEPTDYFWLSQGVEQTIKKEYFKQFKTDSSSSATIKGKALIAVDIIKKMVLKVLKYDEQYAPFQMLGLEVGEKDGLVYSIPVNNHDETFDVKLSGFIDRMDLKNNVLRVIDYKTGKDSKDFANIESLFDRDNSSRNKAVFQVLLYSLICSKKYSDTCNYKIQPTIITTQQLFDTAYDPRVRLKETSIKYQKIADISPFLDEFEKKLNEMVNDIYDADGLFYQTDDEKKCVYCDFSKICNR